MNQILSIISDIRVVIGIAVVVLILAVWLIVEKIRTKKFRKELEEFKNIKRVEITSAIELDEGKKNYIKEQLAQKLQKEIYPTWNVDSSIIGGLVFNIDETVVDNSIKHRLENLKKQITKV